MHTSHMIYQAATAHQTDLRRTASRGLRTADRDSGRSAWNRAFAAMRLHQERPQAAPQPTRPDIALTV